MFLYAQKYTIISQSFHKKMLAILTTKGKENWVVRSIKSKSIILFLKKFIKVKNTFTLKGKPKIRKVRKIKKYVQREEERTGSHLSHGEIVCYIFCLLKTPLFNIRQGHSFTKFCPTLLA